MADLKWIDPRETTGEELGKEMLIHFSGWFPCRDHSMYRHMLELPTDELTKDDSFIERLSDDYEKRCARVVVDLDTFLRQRGISAQECERQVLKYRSMADAPHERALEISVDFFNFVSPSFEYLVDVKGHNPKFLTD